LIVGGGIMDLRIQNAYDAGADFVVIGTLLKITFIFEKR
jgi:heptaprenylglyceryl phosphate synthase